MQWIQAVVLDLANIEDRLIAAAKTFGHDTSLALQRGRYKCSSGAGLVHVGLGKANSHLHRVNLGLAAKIDNSSMSCVPAFKIGEHLERSPSVKRNK